MAIFVDTIIEFETLPETIAEFEAWTMTVAEFEAGFFYGAPPIEDTRNIDDMRFQALGNQGFTGHINDRTLQWLKANGATSGNINDAWHEMLTAQGVPWTFHVNDGWFLLLGVLGYEGSLNDRESQFWKDGGEIGPGVLPYPPALNAASNALIYGEFNDLEPAIEYRMDTDPFDRFPFLTNPDPNATFSIGVSLDAQLIGLGGTNLQVWETAALPWVKIGPYTGINGQVDTVSFSGNGLLVFAGSNLNRVNVLYETYNPTVNYPLLATFDTYDSAMSRNNQWLAVVAVTVQDIHLFNIAELPPVELPALTRPVGWNGTRSVAMHPTLPIMAVGARNASNASVIEVYDIQESIYLGSALVPGSTKAPENLNFNQDGTRLAAGVFDASILYCFNIVDPYAPGSWVSLPISNKPDSRASGCTFSGDDKYLSVINTDGTAPIFRVYDMTLDPIDHIPSFEQSLPANDFTDVNYALTETPPPTIDNLVLTNAVSNEVEANWDLGMPNVASHTVQWKLSTDPTFTDVNVGLDTTYNITGQPSGSTVEVQVYATNASGDGPPTPLESIVVQGIPNPVLNLNAVAGIEQATVSWDAPPSNPAITSYRIELKPSTQTQWQQFISSSFVTSEIIYALKSVMYDFRVVAINALGESAPVVVNAQPSAISVTLSGRFDEEGLDVADPIKFWLNKGAIGSSWDLTQPLGTDTNLVPKYRKEKIYLDSLGSAGLSVEAIATLNQPYSVFSCVAPSALTASKGIIIRDSNGAGFTDQSMATGLANSWAGVDLELSATIPVDGTEMLFSTDFNGIAGIGRLVLNDGSTDISVSGDVGPNNIDVQSILWDVSETGGRFFTGEVFEFRIFNGILNAAEKQAVLGAYQQKWWTGFPYIEPIILYPENWGPMVQGLNNGGTVTNALHNISYGNRRWISVSDDGRSSTSFDDGVTWSANLKGLNVGDDTASLRGIDNDDNNTWVVVTNTGWASRSTDNADTFSTLPRSLNVGTAAPIFRAIVSDKNNTWIALTSSGRASRSIDKGATWLTMPQGLNSGETAVNWHNASSDGQGVFIAVGDNGRASRTDDFGATWTALPQGLGLPVAATNLYDIATDNAGYWIAVGNDGGATASTDNGLTWNQILPQGLNCGLISAAFRTLSTADGRGWVVTASEGWASWSADGVTWYQLTKGLGTAGIPVFFGSDTNERGIWMVCGTGGQAATSTPLNTR